MVENRKILDKMYASEFSVYDIGRTHSCDISGLDSTINFIFGPSGAGKSTLLSSGAYLLTGAAFYIDAYAPRRSVNDQQSGNSHYREVISVSMTFKNLGNQLITFIQEIRPDLELIIDNELRIVRELTFGPIAGREGFRTLSIKIGNYEMRNPKEKNVLDRILSLIYYVHGIDYRSYLSYVSQNFLLDFIKDKELCRTEPWYKASKRFGLNNTPIYDSMYSDFEKIQETLNSTYDMNFFPKNKFSGDGLPMLELSHVGRKYKMNIWLQAKNDYKRELSDPHLAKGLQTFVAFSIITAIQQADIHPIGGDENQISHSAGGIVFIDQYDQNMDRMQERAALDMLLYYACNGRINQFIIGYQDLPLIPSFSESQESFPYFWINWKCPYCGKVSDSLENYCSNCNYMDHDIFKIKCPLCGEILDRIRESHYCKGGRSMGWNQLVDLSQTVQNLGLKCPECGSAVVFTQKECCNKPLNIDLSKFIKF